MRLLITGGAGFIGSNLIKYVLDADPSVEIRTIDNLSNGRASNIAGLPVQYVEGSILDRDVLDPLMEGVDAVVHLAALGSVPRSVAAPRPTHDSNVTGTLEVLESARHAGVGHIVVASSSSVYGGNPALPKSEFDWVRPLSPYAVSKLATEAYTLAYRNTYDMNALAFRFFNVFGPGQPADHPYAAVIPRFVAAALRGEPVTVHGDGLQSRDFTYVGSVCSVLWDAVQRRVSDPNPVNLAFGTRTTLLELLDLLEEEIGGPIAREHVDPRTGDVRASQSDGLRMAELFPDIRPWALKDGLARTVDWFRAGAS